MKIKVHFILLISVLVASGLIGCENKSQPELPVAATNSLLECAARDLLGDSAQILRLAEPGMCPGHFDIRPSQVQRLRSCRVLLRLDFQKALDKKLAGAARDGLRIAEISISGGLCEPQSYMQACRQTADALVDAGILSREVADRRITAITERITQLSAASLERIEFLEGTPVVVSVHQKAFCQWLGLMVAAQFTGADSASVGQIDSAVKLGEKEKAELVIANLPEGRTVADALAGHLGAKVVVFGNFPALNQGQSSFDDLLESNINALVEASGK